jgi:hypothetical protein
MQRTTYYLCLAAAGRRPFLKVSSKAACESAGLLVSQFDLSFGLTIPITIAEI